MFGAQALVTVVYVIVRLAHGWKAESGTNDPSSNHSLMEKALLHAPDAFGCQRG